jgi:hypothetical protein
MSLLIIRAKIKPEYVAEVEAAATGVFAEVERAQPKGMRYAACRHSDSADFVILLGLEEGLENPLNALPAYREFLQRLKDWIAEPPRQDQLTVVGSYRLF